MAKFIVERLSKKELEKVSGGTIFWSVDENGLQKYFVRGREFDTRQSAITASMNLGERLVFIEVGTVALARNMSIVENVGRLFNSPVPESFAQILH